MNPMFTDNRPFLFPSDLFYPFIRLITVLLHGPQYKGKSRVSGIIIKRVTASNIKYNVIMASQILHPVGIEHII